MIGLSDDFPVNLRGCVFRTGAKRITLMVIFEGSGHGGAIMKKKFVKHSSWFTADVQICAVGSWRGMLEFR